MTNDQTIRLKKTNTIAYCGQIRLISKNRYTITVESIGGGRVYRCVWDLGIKLFIFLFG
ncbi:MAG: hypothetical protein LBJ00_07915 [Planctomycetaceae bacterium]|nr:hypothetical protein [Planctomycetaceae bacterium]